MSEGYATVALTFGITKKVPVTTSPSGCLFICRSEDGVQWALCHHASGYVVGLFEFMRAAVGCAESIDHLDWDNLRLHQNEIISAVNRWGGNRHGPRGPLTIVVEPS